MKVNIIGVAHKSKQRLLGSPYIEKELEFLGFTTAQFSVRDGGGLEQALLASDKPGTLVLCPLTGNSQVDALCIANISEACGKSLGTDQQVAQSLARRSKLSKEEIQAMSTLPQGAKVFASKAAAMPGFEIAGKGLHVIVLPADPIEQTGIFFNYLFPLMAKNSHNQCSCHVVRVMDLSVQQVEGAIKDIIAAKDPCAAVFEKPGEVIVRVSAIAQSKQQATSDCVAMMREVVKRLGSYVYGIDVNNVEHALTLICAKRGIKVVIAESGSGTLASRRMGLVNNGKDYLSNAWSYQPETMNLTDIGINNKITEKFGAVSANVAAAMALGITKQSEEKNLIGIGISLPNAQVQNRQAYIAACMREHCLIQELNVEDYRSVSQMAQDAVSRVFNLARKFADSYPQPPRGAVSAEDAVLQGILVAQNTATDLATLPDAALASEGAAAQNNNPPPPKGFKKILHAIFPVKGDTGFDKFRKVVLLLCICVFCGSMFYLVDFGAKSKQSQTNISNLQQEMEKAEKDVEEGKVSIEGYPDDYLPKFVSFYKRNEDIKGWIKIPNTNVNFPVVQTSDNDYYHRLGFDKEYDYYGTPYLDYEVDVKRPSTNVIVYGHNIKNDGQMFNDLLKYRQLDFYKQNPVVNFDSVYKMGGYKIVGAFITNTEPSHDNGNVFEYTHFINAETQQEFDAFIEDVRKRSIFDTPVDAKFGDELLTLSTCTYEFKEARFVVVARRVREGEAETVDVSKAAINEDAYYPAVYAGAAEYQKKLGKVKSIGIQNKKDITLEMGKTVTLTAKVSPADAPIKTYTWDSSNKACATVDKKTGLVTAVGKGESMITAVADDGGYVDNVKVTVTAGAEAPKEKEDMSLSLSEKTMNLKPSETGTLKASLSPKDTKSDLKWKSEDESIVKVTGSDSNATITAVSAGSAKVTVSTADGKLSAYCKVTVAKKAPEEGEPLELTSIAFPQKTMNLVVGTPQTIRLAAVPSSQKPGSVNVEFSGGDILKIKQDATGMEVTLTPVGEGEGKLTATTDTGLKASCTVKIKVPSPEDTTPDIKISIDDLTLLPGKEGQLIYSVEPSNTSLTWSSSDPRIADVDDSGYVTTIVTLDKTTSVAITAETKDGAVKKSATVTVLVEGNGTGTTPPEPNDPDKNANLGLQTKDIVLEAHTGKELYVKVNGTADTVSVEFSSNNTSVAEVESDGYVRGLTPGTAKITVKATNHKTKETQTVTATVTVLGSNTDPVPDSDAGTNPAFGYGTNGS